MRFIAIIVNNHRKPFAIIVESDKTKQPTVGYPKPLQNEHGS